MNSRRLSLYAVGATLLAGCGCAGSMQPASQRPMPTTKGEARIELAELDRQINETRVALGLGPRTERPDSAGKSVAGGEAPPREEMLDRAAAAAPPAPRSVESVQTTGSTESDEEDARDRRLRRCQQNKSCRFTKAICHAAERICRLARFIAETDAQKRCLRAQKDCQDARKATAGTCSDC